MAGAVVAGVAGAVLGVFLVSAGEVVGAAVGVLGLGLVLVLGVGLSGVGHPIGITRGGATTIQRLTTFTLIRTREVVPDLAVEIK
jgi:hypothetical protein